MPFGQSLGPPATARQLNELLELLHVAGHRDFRDARGPMGFTQRQAAGRFTRDEATEYIERLQESGPEPLAETAPKRRAGPGDPALRAVPDERLAAELDRRGWIVIAP